MNTQINNYLCIIFGRKDPFGAPGTLEIGPNYLNIISWSLVVEASNFHDLLSYEAMKSISSVESYTRGPWTQIDHQMLIPTYNR